MNSFYSREELDKIGFKYIGEDVSISRKASIYSPEKMTIGNHVRIDDFCILSGHIELKNYIHVAAYSALYGAEAGIYVGDFAGISSRTAVYAASDDYSGEYLSNPTVPNCYRMVQEEKVEIGRHVIIGSCSTIMPGAILREGAAFGAMSFITGVTEPWTINVGIPARTIKKRKKELLKKEKELENQ